MRILKGGIAFFDSGIGGMTVLAECQKRCKGEIFYYYGDNKHAPYGNLPPAKIRRYVEKAFRKFRRLKVKAVVVACNTCWRFTAWTSCEKNIPFRLWRRACAIYGSQARGRNFCACYPCNV